MIRSDVRGWFEAYDRNQQSHKEGHAGLAWLGLLGHEDGENPSERVNFDRNVASDGPSSEQGEHASVVKPVGSATRLALLLWAGTVASLAVLFG